MEYKYYEEYNETVYKKTLNNGLKVVLIPKNDFYKTFITFTTKYGAMDLSFIPVGKTNKVNQNAGMAHFLEHKLFKEADGTDALEKFDSLGLKSNAFTTFSETSYIISGTENINEGLNLLLDFVQSPYFTDENIVKEQGIIEEEINMYLERPNSRLHNELLKNTYKNLPINKEILGSKESINNITKNDLYTAYETFYHPSNMHLVISGNFDVDEILEVIEKNQSKKEYEKVEEIKRFYPFEPKKVFIKESSGKADIATPLVGVAVKLEPKDTLKKQCEKVIKVRVLLEYFFANGGAIYEKLLALNLINNSFTYYLNSHNNSLSFHIASYTTNPDKLIKTLRQSLVNLNRRKFDEKRFEMIKKAFYGSFIRSLNSVEGINYAYLDRLPYEVDLFETADMLFDITFTDIKELMKEIKSDAITSYKLVPKKG